MRFAALAAALMLVIALPAVAEEYGNYEPDPPRLPAYAPPTAPTVYDGATKPGTRQPSAPQQAPSPSGDLGHSFASIVCPQRIGCLDRSSEAPTVADLAGYANSCITQYFGYTSDSGFIDDGRSLDSQGCLTSKPNVIPRGMGAHLAPHCCVSTLPTKSCALRCELIAVE